MATGAGGDLLGRYHNGALQAEHLRARRIGIGGDGDGFDILRQLLGDNDDFLGLSLDVFICRLRHDAQVQLRNVNRVGFVLEV